MDAVRHADFERIESPTELHALSEVALDALDFGVIAFDAAHIIRRYNACESRFSGMTRHDVLGRHVFTEVAQCMNNYMVAQRYEDAAAAAQPLNSTLDYVLTWRMKPTRVQLKMLYAPGTALRYLLLRHGVPR